MSRELAAELARIGNLGTPAVAAVGTVGATGYVAPVPAGAAGSLNGLDALASELNAARAGNLQLHTFLRDNGIAITTSAELTTALQGAHGEELARHIVTLGRTETAINDALHAVGTTHGPAAAGGRTAYDMFRGATGAVPPGAGAAAAGTIGTITDRAGVLNYVRNGTAIPRHTGAIVTAQDINSGVFPEYERLREQAELAFGARNAGGPPSTLRSVSDTIRNTVDAHERTMGNLEGSLPKKEIDRIVKDHLRDLKQSAGEVSAQMAEGVRAHKTAAATLGREYAQWNRDLTDAWREARTAAGNNATALREIDARFNNVQSAMNSVHSRQMGTHERALDEMKTVVESLEENGIKLKKTFNFELGEKAIVNKTESAAGRAADEAAARSEHMPPAPKGHMMGIGIGAVAGATAAHFMKGDDNDSIMPEVFGGVAGGIVGRIVSGFRRGSEVALGSAGRAAELAPGLLQEAASHARL